MAPHSSTLAWKIPWVEEPGRLLGSLRVGHNWVTSLSLFTLQKEANGNPFQCPCLKNPRDGGSWWAAVYGSHRVGHDWSDLAAAAARKLTGGNASMHLQEISRPHWTGWPLKTGLCKYSGKLHLLSLTSGPLTACHTTLHAKDMHSLVN